MASNLGETSMNMSLLNETVSHLSNQNIDSDVDLDENEYCSETIADHFGYSDSDEEIHRLESDGWEIVTSSSSSESPSGSDSDDENVHIAASGRSPTSGKQVVRRCQDCNAAERQMDKLPRKRPGRESSYQCDISKISLCIGLCFKLYHKRKNYIQRYIDLKKE